MSLHSEDTRSLDTDSEGLDVVSTKPKVSYSREFLLSLSNLDSCTQLPSGFDESLISEFEDASLVRVPDRPRIPGSLPLQGFRQNDYSSSPPARGDGISYSRVIYGKWENRSSGRSDRDNDSQSDRDSDAGRRYGHQSRRSWQSPEHDGLLGSGSFPRPSGYAAGVSAPKVRVNEPNQLSRTNEPYQPPRPYKAVPHSRRDTDAFNDETFGSMENTSEDRAEEERKRRASFEMMRKEQHKALQEKQKEKYKPTGVSELSDVLGDSKEENGIPIRNHELEVSAGTPTPILSSDLEKSSFVSHSPASRPLIPPGFKSNTLEKSPVLKPLSHPPLSEVGKSVTGESLVDANGNLVQSTNDGLEKQSSQDIVVDGQPADKRQHARLLYKGEDVNVHASLDVPIMKPGMEDHLVSHGTHVDPDIAGLNSEVLEDKTIRDSNISYPTSILGKIFGSTLSVSDGHSSSTEHHDGKPDDTWSPGSVQSSKFALWFSEEESKAASAISSARPNNLLSLIVGGDDRANGTPDEVYINNKEEAPPSVLTCEDLEQSILSEYSTKTTNVQPVLKNWSATSANTELPSAHVGDHASLQLLSILQKSTEQSNTTPDSAFDVNLNDKRLVSRQHEIANVFPKREEKGKNLPDAGNTLTLETLFGTAFMKELQSVEAPVSAQRGSTGSSQVDATDHDISSPTIDKIGLQRPSHDYSISTNPRHHTRTSEAENWLGFDDPRIKRSSSGLHSEAIPKQGFERVLDFQLPEEDNLLSLGDTLNRRMFTGNSSTKASLTPNTAISMTEKMTALGAVLKDKLGMEGSESLPFARDAYEQMDPEITYRVQQSSPLFLPPQMSQVRPPLYHHLEPHSVHMSSQMKFMGPEPIFNHDSPANHQFPSNVIQPSFHPNVRVAGFDVPSQHSILHQMQIQGNHPPHFPRGGPVSHNGNQAIQGMNQMQSFPSDPRQPNIGNRGVPMTGNNPPEAFQRLVEMELRANSKQIHPFAPGHGQGVDMGFRYR